jgi:multidrug efflux pump subunit AcrA (membrane-fusion protein)
MDEKPGSTRIIEIKPEGMVVKAGEVVCRLDSAAFRDELQSQMIKVEQAKSWVEQAASILAVNEITFREYRDGIYPQDLMLVRQYLTACTLEAERAQKNVEWSKETLDKGYRASAQYKADLLALQRAELALREAKRMEERLVKYTGPKILKSLEAKLESIRADKLAQESAYQLEMDRKRRLERMIANCTLAAPREGIVVYSNQSNMWGRSTARIEEGATVREGQPIFDLPDPKHMRLKARINESKLSFIRTGQKALVRVEAFPDRPLTATVAEITPIPAPTNVMSDTRVYFAIVNIDDSSQLDLRPGLTAEISFYFDTHKNVTRLPIESVRWVDRKAYVAVPTQNAEDAKSPRWSWKPIKVGLANATHIEILEGLAAGDKVIADPAALPAPRPSDLRQTAGAGTSAAKG